MKKLLSVFTPLLLLLTAGPALSQTGCGMGIYATGTEAGMGFRSGRNSMLAADMRVAKAGFYSKPGTSSFISEANLVWRIIRLEKLRFHSGIGYRTEWNFPEHHRHGWVVPLGVEAFPFPFPNAGLFFEGGFYATYASGNRWQGGLRTAAGFVFYFPTHTKEKAS